MAWTIGRTRLCAPRFSFCKLGTVWSPKYKYHMGKRITATVGDRYGLRTITAVHDEPTGIHYFVTAQCDCGKVSDIPFYVLRQGRCTACKKCGQDASHRIVLNPLYRSVRSSMNTELRAIAEEYLEMGYIRKDISEMFDVNLNFVYHLCNGLGHHERKGRKPKTVAAQECVTK